MGADRRAVPGRPGPRVLSRLLCAAVTACVLVGGAPAAGGSATPDDLVADRAAAGSLVTDDALVDRSAPHRLASAASAPDHLLVSLPVVDGQTVDYSSGPYADRLCPTTAASGVSCSLGRSLLATVQGAGHRERAVGSGATCERQDGLWVCFDVRSLLVQRGGTTYGDTFLTPDGQRSLGADLVAHESEHVRQWRLFGPDFSLMYLAEGVDPCGNYFEQQAGLAAGGYSCG